MTGNALKRLAALGQSVWYDSIRRDLYQGGELQRLIQEDGLSGMTSNPTIFQKAIAETGLYDDAIRRLSGRGLPAEPPFEAPQVRARPPAPERLPPPFVTPGGPARLLSLSWEPAPR